MFWLIISLLIIAIAIASFAIFRLNKKKPYEGRGTTIKETNNPASSAALPGRGANFGEQNSERRRNRVINPQPLEHKQNNSIEGFNANSAPELKASYSKENTVKDKAQFSASQQLNNFPELESLKAKQPTNQAPAPRVKGSLVSKDHPGKKASYQYSPQAATIKNKNSSSSEASTPENLINPISAEKILNQKLPNNNSKADHLTKGQPPSSNPTRVPLNQRNSANKVSPGYQGRYNSQVQDKTVKQPFDINKTNTETAYQESSPSSGYPTSTLPRSGRPIAKSTDLPQDLANKAFTSSNSQNLNIQDLENLKELSSKTIFQDQKVKLSSQDEPGFNRVSFTNKEEQQYSKPKISPFTPQVKDNPFTAKSNLVEKIVDVVNSSVITDIDKTVLKRTFTTDSTLDFNFKSSQARKTHPNDDISSRQAKAKEEAAKQKAKAQDHRELSLIEEQKAAQKSHQTFKDDNLTPEQKRAKELAKRKAKEAEIAEAKRQAELAKAKKEEEERQKAEKLRIEKEVAKNPALLVTDSPKDFVSKIGLINLDPKYPISKLIAVLKKRKEQNNDDKKKHDQLGKLNFYDAIDSAINTALGYLEAYKEAFGDIIPKDYINPSSDKEGLNKVSSQAKVTTNPDKTPSQQGSHTISKSATNRAEDKPKSSPTPDSSTQYAMTSLTSNLASDYKQKVQAKEEREEQARQAVNKGINPSLQSNIAQEVNFDAQEPELPASGEGFEVMTQASPISNSGDEKVLANDPFAESKKKIIFRDFINLYIKDKYPQYSVEAEDSENSLPRSEFFEEVALADSILDFALSANAKKADLPAIIESYIEVFESKAQEFASQQASQVEQ